MRISDSIVYVGVFDRDIDLFEGQYAVPTGVSYNSYIIFDEKIAVMDTVDSRKTKEWLANVEAALNGKMPDYLVVQHLEPDHSGSIQALADKYQDIIDGGYATDRQTSLQAKHDEKAQSLRSLNATINFFLRK